MLKLSTWYDVYLKNGKKDWEEYVFTIEDIQGHLSEKYKKGASEKFADISEVARRVVQLRREDDACDVEVINGFVYSSEHHKFTNGKAYIPLDDNSVQIRRPLNENELKSMSDEIRAILSGN